MAVYSGKGAKLEAPSGTEVPDVAQIEITKDPETQEYANSSTSTNRRGTPGNTRTGGSLTVHCNDSGMTVGKSGGPVPGTETTLNFWEVRDDEATKHVFTVVLWGEMSTTQDNDSGAIVEATITFISNGTYTAPTRA